MALHAGQIVAIKEENVQFAANLVIAVEKEIILLGMETVQLGQLKLLWKIVDMSVLHRNQVRYK